MINNCLKEKDLPVYGDGMQVRDWLHVSDHCSAIDTVLHKGRDGKYIILVVIMKKLIFQ